jgi:4-amino-4-deoxy-L-arabinose transferase-like glycosyltransferase
MISTQALPLTRPSIRVQHEPFMWAGVILLAAILRFRDLGARPLDPDEARVALEAFRGVGFGRPWGSPETASPGYTGAMSLVFFLFGSSDAAARLLSALAGVALVALPMMARPLLDRNAALGVAALLAISPVLIESARSALSGSLLATLLLLAVIAASRLLLSLTRGEPPPIMWVYVIGASLTAGLATDTTFALHVLGLGVACAFAFDINVIRARLREIRSVPVRPLLVSIGWVLLLYTTRGLTNPGGLQTGFIDAFWSWSGDILQTARAPIAPFMVLLGTECLIVVVAVGGAVTVSKSSALERFAAAWTAVAVAIAVIAGRIDYWLLTPAVLAAALLGGPWLARVLQHDGWRDRMTYLLGGVAAVPLIAAVTASLPALRLGNAPPTQVPIAALAGLAGTLVGGIALVGRRATANGLLLVTLTVAVAGTFVGAARLTASTSSDLGRAGQGAVFTEKLHEVERQLAIWEWDQDRRPILVDDRLQGNLGWVLRSNRNVTWVPAEEIVAAPAVKLGSVRGDPLPERGVRLTVGYRFTGPGEISPPRVAEWLLWRRSIPRVEPYDILLFR